MLEPTLLKLVWLAQVKINTKFGSVAHTLKPELLKNMTSEFHLEIWKHCFLNCSNSTKKEESTILNHLVISASELAPTPSKKWLQHSKISMMCSPR